MMYLPRVLGETAAEGRKVLRAGTPTHGRLRDRPVAIALVTVGFEVPGRALDVVMEI